MSFTHEVVLKAKKDRALLEKKTNYFNESKESYIGIFNVDRTKINDEIEFFIKIKKRLEYIDAKLAKVNQSINSLNGNNERELYIKIDDKKLFKSSTMFKKAYSKLVSIINSKYLKLISGSKIDFNGSILLTKKDGKIKKKKIKITEYCRRFKNTYLCKIGDGVFILNPYS